MKDSYLKTCFEFLKLRPRDLISLGIIAAFLLFGPDEWLKLLSVYEFAQNYRQWLALLLIITGVLFGVDRTIEIFGWIRNTMLVQKFAERTLERLNSLTEEEKQILRFYFLKETRTNYLRIGDGVVQGLIANRIIRQSSNVGHLLDGFAYNISDLAWDYLHENIHLLNGTTDLARTDKREQERW